MLELSIVFPELFIFPYINKRERALILGEIIFATGEVESFSDESVGKDAVGVIGIGFYN